MVSENLIRIWHRIYSDFFLPTRLEEYRLLLEEALNYGYKIYSVEQFWAKIKTNMQHIESKQLILRHDVDTDSSCARAMWKIDCSLGINASYYFRRPFSTLDVKLMQEITSSCGEAGYHFEEIATVIKQKGLMTKEQVYLEMAYIRNLFKNNLNLLRKRTGIPIQIVASHGDFVNRRLGVPNWLILQDYSFRKEVGIELEVYDEAFMHHVISRHADCHYPQFWRPCHPIEAIYKGEPVIYLLIHPRHWRANICVNGVDDVRRVWQDFVYLLRSRLIKYNEVCYGK